MTEKGSRASRPSLSRTAICEGPTAISFTSPRTPRRALSSTRKRSSGPHSVHVLNPQKPQKCRVMVSVAEPPFLAGAGAETITLFRLRQVFYKSIFINSFFVNDDIFITTKFFLNNGIFITANSFSNIVNKCFWST